MPVDLICEMCGRKYARWPSLAGRRKYCSNKCANARWEKTRIDRFWSKVDKAGDCWLWTRSRNGRGYGQVSWGAGGPQLCHRVAWELLHGPIPEGLHVCHDCDNPPCVNPDHLFLGTDLDNVRDCMAKNRFARGARHGMHLHPEKHPRGEAHGTARLTNAKVLEMRRQYGDGEGSYEVIGKRFGVTLTTAYNAITGKTWSHL